MKISVSNERTHSIDPKMIGLFFEDINYAGDGGLYAEMIENRSFSFVKAEGQDKDFCVTPARDYGWTTINSHRGRFRTVQSSALSPANPDYARLDVYEKGFSLKNKAYDGIFLKKDETYNLLIWARTLTFEGNIECKIQKDAKVYAQSIIDLNNPIDEKYNFWKLYSVTLKASDDIEYADFILSFEGRGIIEIAYVSLIPADAVLGIFRKDLYNLLKELKPGFVRFPGGCIVEGATLQNRYDYKNTLKPTWDRKTNWNRWAVHGSNKERNYLTDYSWYNQTYGLGFYEYFLLCDNIGAKPLPVLNVGFACQYQSNEMVAIESEAFEEFLQDALDLIEFANGDVSTKWGAVRKNMGHEAPFNLEFLGIGNEQWQTERADFFERYLKFEETIHAIYPEIKLIGSAGPDITSEKYTMAWDFYRKNQDKENFAYALDEHYYVKPEYLFEHNDFYDDYDRKIKVFSGEYAAHPVSGFNMPEANTLYGALSEAAFMTGVERNSDVVVLASYAPLFARVNYAQWSPDMIWFDAKNAYGSPSYFVQKMYANNMGDFALKVSGVKEAISQGIYYNLSFDSSSGERILKIVNANDFDVEIDLEGESEIAAIKLLTMTGDEKDAYNSIDNMDRVSVSESLVSGNVCILPKYSFTVARF